MRTISEIIIHYSESSFGDVPTIKQWHMERKRPDGTPVFSDIAYHFVICNGVKEYHGKYDAKNDGELQAGRPVDKLGGGVFNHHQETIEVCLVTKTEPTVNQLGTLKGFIEDCLKIYPIKIIAGHEAFEATDCPHFPWRKWLEANGYERFLPKGATK